MMYTNWNSCLDSGRNELLFENRNKLFGAYVIRRDYSKNVLLAFLITSFVFGGLLIFSFISLSIPIPPLMMNAKPDDGIHLIEIDIPSIVEPLPPTKSEAAPPLSGDELVNPVVVDRPPVETILPAPTGSSEHPGLIPTGSTEIVTTGTGSIAIPTSINDDKPVKWAEKMPKFPGGDEVLMQFLASKIRYPEDARINNIEGTVYISFVVDSNGKVTQVKLLRGIFQKCDEEALRAVLSMPNWIPGNQNGQNVSVELSLPVNFRLK